jgi:hypothetical protein
MTSVPSDIRLDRLRGRVHTRAAVGAVALLAALLWLAAPARADVGATIIEKCAQGKSIAGYTQQDYRRALQELPTEVEEYSTCANQIRRAQLAAAGGAGATEAGASATPLTPAEQRGIAALKHAPSAPFRVGNQLIHPGVVHADIASAFSTLPNAVLAVLALIAAGALALAGRTIRHRVGKRSAG